jgi:hypothetical protein
MTSTQLRKYDFGRAQKNRRRERADRVLLECGVDELLSEPEGPDEIDGDLAVVTVPAEHSRTNGGNGTKHQMLLWDQPVPVMPAADPQVAPPPTAARSVSVAEPARVPQAALRRLPMEQRSPAPSRADAFTAWGFLKGCGMGLAAAGLLLLIYVLVG